MNILWLYVISVGLIFLVLGTGYFIGGHCTKTLNTNSTVISSSEISGKELTEILIKKNKLLNVGVVKLNSKKTNYYSIKYNVIKASPDVNSSPSLTALAISATLANNARLGQKRTIIYCINLIVSFISKICSLIFIPIVLICAIINSSIISTMPSLIILIAIILYASSLVIQLIVLCFELISTNKLNRDLKSLKIFTKDELTHLTTLLKAICRLKFWNYTISTISFFNLASPNLVSGNTIN